MRIRRATIEDAPALAEQMKVVVDEDRWLGTQRDRTVGELTERFRSGLEDGHILFALEDGQRIVGAIGIHPTRIGGVHSLGMSILAEYRGGGWGRRLIEVALDAAREAVVRKVTLEVWPDNGRAVSLYASCGFDVEGYKRDHYPRLDGSVRSSILMARFP
jgi:ribosomal protein S18 acetylase RimI-like enzyme